MCVSWQLRHAPRSAWGCSRAVLCAQASGVLFLQQVDQGPNKPAWGIHPVTRQVVKLPAAHVALAAVQVSLLAAKLHV